MKYLLSIFTLLLSITVNAQNISVADFHLDEMDLTANQQGTIVLDQNGEKCALIRIQTTQKGFSFDVGSLGVQKIDDSKAGEIWMYIPAGVRKLTIRHPQLGSLINYNIPINIKAARTYLMQLTSDNVQTIIKKDDGGNFLVMKTIPSDATLYIDGQIQKNDAKGEYSIFLSYGKHEYKVEAASYSTDSGNFTIGKETTNLNISLHSTLATLSVFCPTVGSQIFINKKHKGQNCWNGTLAAGRYLIEAKKDGYRSITENVLLAEKESKSITLSELQPIYGTLKVNVRPAGSMIVVDGDTIGRTPKIMNDILVGKHNLKIVAVNGNAISKVVTIEEGMLASVDSVIPEFTAKQLIDIANNAFSDGDYEKAFTYSFKAANTGSSEGAYNLANLYVLAVGLGNTKYKESLTKIAKEKYGITDCESEMIKWTTKAAELGDMNAQANLGAFYFMGTGVKKDYTQAIKWLTKAAEQGSAQAECLLGHCYYYGDRVVAQDYNKAIEWYIKAANKGVAVAQYRIGYCYYNGDGVLEDYKLAVEWYTKAANQGNADAQFDLGWCYSQGKGVAQNYVKAAEWYTKAANQGNAQAQCNLGVFYHDGKGVPKDDMKSAEWYRKAAEQGNAYAKKMLKKNRY